MARNGKDLEVLCWHGIVVLYVLHAFQGPECCQKSKRRINDTSEMNLLSKLEILKPEKKISPMRNNFF